MSTNNTQILHSYFTGKTVANKQATHGLWSSVGLKMPIHIRFFQGGGRVTIKVGQTNLFFVLWSEPISRSVHARLKISKCSGYDLCQPG